MTTKTTQPLAERIRQGLQESLAFCRGEKHLRTVAVLDGPPPITPDGIVELRESLHVTQVVFAQLLNVSPKVVQTWERGLRAPSKSSLRLLQVIQQRPDAVAEVVGLTASPGTGRSARS